MTREIKLEDLLTAPAEADSFFVTDLGDSQSLSDAMIDRMNNAVDDFLPDETDKIPDYLINDPQVVGYPDAEMQDDIYRWVSLSIDKLTSVKDLGCGRGDFARYLQSIAWPNNVEYIGIDQNPVMIAAGRQKYPNVDLRCGTWFNFKEKTDYTVCIGSLEEYNQVDAIHFFQRTVQYAIETTDVKAIFVFTLDGDNAELANWLSTGLISWLSGYPFELDYSRYSGICKMTLYPAGFRLA